MSNIISWLSGLLSLANIKAELVSLKTEMTQLKEEYQTTQRALQDLVDKIDTFENECSEVSDKIDERIDEWSNDNLDDRIEEYIMNFDFSDIISNELRNHDFISSDELDEKVEEAFNDFEISKPQIRDAVEYHISENWFELQVKQIVKDECNKLVTNGVSEEEKQNNEVIEDYIREKIVSQVHERMEAKFGEGWDSWFEEHTRYCVKNILGEFLNSAYEQTKQK